MRGQETIREAVGVFNNMDALNAAVAELENTDFPRQDISVLASEHEIEQTFGSPHIRSEFMEDNPDAPRTILVRPEEKVIGTAVIIGGGFYAGAVTSLFLAGAGTMTEHLLFAFLGGIAGGALGSLVAWLLNRAYNRGFRKKMGKGGMVLWVRTPGQRQEELARDILRRHGGTHVHLHDIS